MPEPHSKHHGLSSPKGLSTKLEYRISRPYGYLTHLTRTLKQYPAPLARCMENLQYQASNYTAYKYTQLTYPNFGPP